VTRAPAAQERTSLPEQTSEISATMNRARNENVFPFDAVNDDVIAHRETACPFSEIAIACSSGVGECCEENESIGYPVDQLRGNFQAALSLAT
jgi:hypothetical protein